MHVLACACDLVQPALPSLGLACHPLSSPGPASDRDWLGWRGLTLPWPDRFPEGTLWSEWADYRRPSTGRASMSSSRCQRSRDVPCRACLAAGEYLTYILHDHEIG